MGDTGADIEGYVTGTVNRQQAINSPETEESRKARRKKKCNMTRSNDKLVVGARMLYKTNMRKNSEVDIYKCRHVA